MPSLATPVIPGNVISVGCTTRSQIEVPMTMTYVPAPSAPAPGNETNESTLPTATATFSGRPSLPAKSGSDRAGVAPEGKELGAEFGRRLRETGVRRIEIRRTGYAVCF